MPTTLQSRRPALGRQGESQIYRLGTLTVGPLIPATAGTGAVLVAGLAMRG